MSKNVKIKVLTFLRYLGDSFFYPFLAIYLTEITERETIIGSLIALTPLIAIIVNPIYSKICKNAKTLKIVLGTISIFEALGIALITLSNNYYFVLAIIILIGISGTSHYGLLDSLQAMYSEFHQVNYGSIRVYGSLAYAIGTTLSGFVIDYIGYFSSFAICAFLFLITSVFYFTIGDIGEGKKIEKRNYKEVLTNKGFILFFIFYFLVYGSIRTNQNMYGLFLDYRGLSSTQYGIVYTSFVLVEVITLVILDKIDSKINYRIMAMLIAVFMTILFTVNFLNLPIPVILSVGLLRGVAYAMLLHISYKIVMRLVGVQNTIIAVLLMELSVNIFVIIGDSLGGAVMEFNSYSAFYGYLALVCLFALVFYILFVRKHIITKNEVIVYDE